MNHNFHYIMAQQRAEELRRQAEHFRLSREVRRTMTRSSALKVLRWLSFGSARPWAKKDHNTRESR